MAGGFLHSLRYSFSQLCRQLPLLAGLVLLCALLPALAAPALEGMLSSGTGVRSITVALAGVEGEDETTQTLASYLLSMSDVNEFCQVIPMSEEEALSALEKGEVTAALLLPQGFLPSILDGENKAPVLVLDPEQAPSRLPADGELLRLAPFQTGDQVVNALRCTAPAGYGRVIPMGLETTYFLGAAYELGGRKELGQCAAARCRIGGRETSTQELAARLRRRDSWL